MTLDVFSWAKNPFSGWLDVPQVSVGFLHHPDGSAQMARGLATEAKEWLASYTSGIKDELSNEEFF